jgi:hypothetical protein
VEVVEVEEAKEVEEAEDGDAQLSKSLAGSARTGTDRLSLILKMCGK